jgi:hypothetical protein
MTVFLSPHRRRGHPHRVGVAFGLLALCLRLAVPAWAPAPNIAPSGADLVALLGEHALCLAAARGDAPPADPAEPQNAPAQEHDGATCCLFHAALGTALPSAPPAATFALSENRIVHFAAAPTPPSLVPTGAARARAPPTEA